MSKRVTLTDFEIEQIIEGLTALKHQTPLNYQVIKVGRRFYEQLICKLSPKPGEPGYSSKQRER